MSLKTSLGLMLATCALLVGCNDDRNVDLDMPGSNDTRPSVADSVPAQGVDLPYTVLRSDLIDHKTQQPIEIRNGGYGSSMTGDPADSHRFYALTDRGPNASFTGDLGKGKIFPVPDYTPRIGLFEVESNGTIRQIRTILLKRPDGTPITGLPNPAGLGGTGEVPYAVDGTPLVDNPDQPYDAQTNPLRLDRYGLDSEGLVALKDGTFWVSDEYGPHIVHYDATGREIERINPFADDPRDTRHLPAELGHRRANRGMEGLAVTPDQHTLVGLMQSTLSNPDQSVNDADITRLVTIDLQTGTVGQYLYRQDKRQNSNCEIAALSATQFVLIERDGAFLYGGPNGPQAATADAQKTVYRIDLRTGTNLETVATGGGLVQNATLGLTLNGQTLEQVVHDSGWQALAAHNIVPVDKQRIVDMVARVNYPHDKMEGLWIVDAGHLGILNDDDFALWSTDGQLEQKYLDADTIDGNHLYVVPADLSIMP